MIERLCDSGSQGDEVLARAARLIAAAAPLDDSEMAKRRVMARMQLRRSAPSRWPLLLRPAPLLAVLVAGAALAGATVGREALVNGFRRITGKTTGNAERILAPSQPRPVAPARRPVAPALPAAPEAPAAPAVAQSAMAAPAVVSPAPAHLRTAQAATTRVAATSGMRRTAPPAVPAPSLSGAAVTSRVATPPAPEPQSPAATPRASEPPAPAVTPRAPSMAESTLVAGAARALKVEHDPARAGALLDEYLRRFPDGVLAEEALALAIQAATARGDARARDLAQKYVGRYPQGRFARQAQAAAGRP